MKRYITAILILCSFSLMASVPNKPTLNEVTLNNEVTLENAKTNEAIATKLKQYICAELSETQNSQNYERVQILKGYGFNPIVASETNSSVTYMSNQLGDFGGQCDLYVGLAIRSAS